MKLDLTLLEENFLDLNNVQTELKKLDTKGINYGDFYFQYAKNESWHLENSIVKTGAFSLDNGVGIRAIVDDKTAFAYSDEITLPSLNNAVKTVQTIKNQAQGTNKIGKIQNQSPSYKNYKLLYQNQDPLLNLPDKEKIKLLLDIENYARAKSNKIIDVICSLSFEYEKVLILATDQTQASDVRPLVHLNCTLVVKEGDVIEKSSAGGGSRTNFNYFLEKQGDKPRAFTYVDEALEQALLNLTAKPAPAGVMPVVLGAGWPGILLHEAVGHGLEADSVRKESSIFAGKKGQKVASDCCTVIDNGTIKNRRGSLNIDDEGVVSKENVLIKDGILQGYMQDKLNAKLMKDKVTGNARRQSYAHLPLPRMTNTYLANGNFSKDEIIKSVKNGIYAKNFSGGQVNTTTGKFVFSASCAFLIENGKVTSPIKGATLIGTGFETMNEISMLGNDLELDKGMGMCGKDGQTVPVGVGQPSLKIDKITVGGTKA